MNPIRSLLAATDFSEDAAIALRRAAQLSRSLGAALEVVHATRDAETGAAEARLAAAVLPLGLPVASRVLTGSVPEAILEAAQAHDLLVLGAQGANRLRHAILGSTAERILVHSARPILVVRLPGAEPYRRVIVPCEFAPPAKRALILASSVAPNAAITLVHYLDAPGEEARAHQWLRDLANDAAPGATIATHVEHAPAAQALLALAERDGADLVVAGKQGRSRAGDMILGSVTRRILGAARCDVLVAPLAGGS